MSTDFKTIPFSFIIAEETRDENLPEGDHERPVSAEIEKQDVEQSEKEDNRPPEEQEGDSEQYMTSIGRDQVLRRAKLTEYDSFVLAVLKLLLGEYHVRRLITKGVGPRKIENAVLSKSSWQRVPLLVDPYNKGLELIRTIEDGENLLEIDLAERYVNKIEFEPNKAMRLKDPSQPRLCFCLHTGNHDNPI